MSEEITIESTIDDIPIKEKTKGAPETAGDGIIASSSTNRKGGIKRGSIQENNDGIIGSKKAEPGPVVAKETAAKAKKEQNRKTTVAIHSTKNVVWPGVGEVVRGYNIVSEQEAAKWLTRNHIRVATPEEVAEEFGV